MILGHQRIGTTAGTGCLKNQVCFLINLKKIFGFLKKVSKYILITFCFIEVGTFKFRRIKQIKHYVKIARKPSHSRKKR